MSLKIPPPHIYLNQSTIPEAGIGVFAGKHFRKGEIIETAPFIQIEHDYSNKNILNNYVFSSHLDEHKVLITFGYGSMYNHKNENNVDYYRNTAHNDRFLDYIAIKDIQKDEELFINYGKNHNVNKIQKRQKHN